MLTLLVLAYLSEAQAPPDLGQVVLRGGGVVNERRALNGGEGQLEGGAEGLQHTQRNRE